LGIEGSIARSIIVTLAKDKTCKFWEYGSEIKGIFSNTFIESPNCCSLHPLGNQLAIGFKDGLRIYYCLENELK
jgi:hypothetical protein